MQIAQVIGGYTLGGADLLRRAMGKKKPEEMALQRDIFVAGAEKNGLARPKAAQLFDLMEKFAGYGFNKSHSAAYALVAYQTAYFKAHHAAAFMAANLSLVMDDTDKVQDGSTTTRVAQGLAILPPDVNASGYRFEPVDAKQHPLRPRRHQGHGRGGHRRDRRRARRGRPVRRPVRLLPARRQAASSIGASSRRSCAPAHSTRSIHAARRCSPRSASRSTRGERAAATRRRRCRCSARKRRAPMRCDSIADARMDGSRAADAGEDGARLLPVAGIRSPRTPPSSRRSCARRSRALRRKDDRVLVAGIVTTLRVQTSRRGKMAFVTLDDGKGRAEVMVYNETFDAVRTLLREDQLVIMEMRVTQRMTEDGEAQGLRIIAENVFDLADDAQALCERDRSRATATRRPIGSPRSCSRSARARKPITVALRNERIGGELELARRVAREPDDALIERLREWLAPENVQVVY